MRDRLAVAWRMLADALARGNVIERERFGETVELAWPRIVTGFAIMSKRTVDLAVVGIAVGSEAVAGLTIANAYWTVGKLAFIGLAGGTLSLVSQNYGGGDTDRAAEVAGLGLLAVFALAVPVSALFGFGARPLVEILGGGPETTRFGALYLAVVAPGLLFEALNLVASRTYAGIGNTQTPMSIRAGGALLNVALSVGLVFGAGLGVFGAALGTTLSTAAVTAIFTWGLTGHSYFGRGASPIPVGLSLRPEIGLIKQLATVSAPLAARRVGQGLAVFPLLWIAGFFGPAVLAAIGVSRQVRDLLNSFAWGFSIAASTLVGQALGAAKEGLAALYGREIIKLSLVVYLFAGAVVLAAARPIAAVFVDSDLGITATFVRIAALSVVPLGIDGSATGALRGAGDTRVPFLATLAGLYLVALPVAVLGTITSLGVFALQAALLAETGVPMVVNVLRFRTGAWKAISREFRPEQEDSDAGLSE